jgi:hypothetical protein
MENSAELGSNADSPAVSTAVAAATPWQEESSRRNSAVKRAPQYHADHITACKDRDGRCLRIVNCLA